MLVKKVQGDGAGNKDIDHYNVVGWINDRIFYQTRITNHKRKEGWRKLLKQLLETK